MSRVRLGFVLGASILAMTALAAVAAAAAATGAKRDLPHRCGTLNLPSGGDVRHVRARQLSCAKARRLVTAYFRKATNHPARCEHGCNVSGFFCGQELVGSHFQGRCNGARRKRVTWRFPFRPKVDPGKRAHKAVVVCFNGPSPPGHFLRPVFRTEPRKCNFVYRQAPHPEGIATEEMVHLRWRTWDHSHARGIGGLLLNGAPHPVRTDVSLYRALNRCGGRRVFAKARFKIHYKPNPRSFTMPLHTCF